MELIDYCRLWLLLPFRPGKRDHAEVHALAEIHLQPLLGKSLRIGLKLIVARVGRKPIDLEISEKIGSLRSHGLSILEQCDMGFSHAIRLTVNRSKVK